MAQILNTALIARNSLDHSRTQALYNGLDCTVTRELADKTLPLVAASAPVSLIYRFEMALRAPALEMMLRGLRVDPNERTRMIWQCEEKIERLKEVLNAIIEGALGWKEDPKGWRLNPASPSRLKYFFYGVLGLPEHTKYEKGERKVTVNKDALTKFQDSPDPLISYLCTLMLTLRDLGKTVGTLRWSLERDGRMRFNFSPTGTTTGRWTSSSNIYRRSGNAQQITSRIRRIFVADPGRKFAYVDLKNAESRAVAYLSGDEAYIEANESALKVHTFVAQMVWPEHDWPSDPHAATSFAKSIILDHKNIYALAKVGSHGGNYMSTPPTMARSLKIPLALAKDFQRRYFTAFPGIRLWHEQVARQLQLHGTLITPMGRRRRFFGRAADKTTLREAVAFVPQSTIGDILNLALLRVWKHLYPRVRLLSQLHDAILIDYAEADEDSLLPLVLELMQIPVKIGSRTMTIPCDVEVGWNWEEISSPAVLTRNPDGLTEWSSHDPRTRTFPAEIAPMDLIL